MRIGQLADKAGVNIQTIRFYERRKILPEPLRNASGYRAYGDADLDNIRFVKQSQELGFSLREIQQLMKLHQAASSVSPASVRKPREWKVIAQITQARLKHVERNLRLLKTMRVQLLSMLHRLEAANSRGCPASPKPDGKSLP
jgi:MerR family mercuric resistance operon transcriptional regulator